MDNYVERMSEDKVFPLRRAISALLLPSLISGADLGAWPDCWVSAEYLHSSILRKRSDTITPPRPADSFQRMKKEDLIHQDKSPSQVAKTRKLLKGKKYREI